jgi:plastocyanin
MMKSIGIRLALSALLVLGLISGSAAGSGAQASGSATVGIRQFRYRPGTLVVRRGTRVIFSNSDRVAHTATRRGSFDTGTIRPGHAVAVRFTRRGSFSYFCRLHPFMHGKIVVR